MALKDKVSLGVALPHRSPEPIDVAAVRRVAQRAEVLGFRDLWVTETPWTMSSASTRWSC